MAFRTISIGRHRDAEIRLGDETVSRLHAELTVTKAGHYYLTDRGSRHGTWVYRDGKWSELRQDHVGPAERIRFGKFETRFGELIRGRSFDLEAYQPRYRPISIQPLPAGDGDIKATKS